ncbi:hypothetical protein CerSpe_074530 [Prunus speciosa]
METKVSNNNMERLQRSCGFQQGFYVPPIRATGGFSLWWDNCYDLEIIAFSKNFIDMRMTKGEIGIQSIATWVYDTLYREEKKDFWGNMESDFPPTNLPWFCGGDFNEIMWSFEKNGGIDPSPSRLRFLQDFMKKVELLDLGYQGYVEGTTSE